MGYSLAFYKDKTGSGILTLSIFQRIITIFAFFKKQLIKILLCLFKLSENPPKFLVVKTKFPLVTSKFERAESI